jgi:lipopolysaccharide biosynthesis glycosyltransferase
MSRLDTVTPISLLCCFDAAYSRPALVTLYSAVSHLPDDCLIDIHVVSDMSSRAVGEFLGQPLRRLNPNCDVRLMEFDPKRFTGASRSGASSPFAYGRLLLPEIEFRSPRVLYLDTDLLVCSSIEPLWASDLAGMTAGAVVDELFATLDPRLAAHCSMPAGEPYFNSGVMLIDAAKWREEDVSRRSIDFVTQHPDLCPCGDQCALNATLVRRWKPLPGTWNAQVAPPGARMSEIVRGASIIHFNWYKKPWVPRYSRNAAADRYFRTARRAGIRNWRPSLYRYVHETVRELQPVLGYRLQQLRKGVGPSLHQFRQP